MTDAVLRSTDNGVLTITLNRPEKRNALTGEMYGLISDALDHAAKDKAVRVAVIKGAGENFTAGNDLAGFADAAGAGPASRDSPVRRLMEIMIDFEKPLVAAVRGPAVGIGTTMLLHCDLVIATRDATFAMPFTRLGVVPEFASSLLLPMIGGRVRASHTLLLGEAFDVDWARDLGLVSEVCDNASLDEVVRARTATLAGLPPRSLRETKRLLNPPELRKRMRAVILEEGKAFEKGLQSDEHKEAVKAFFEKRKPDFSQFS